MIARGQGAAATRWPRLAVGSRDRCRSSRPPTRALAASAQAVRAEEAPQQQDERPQAWQPLVAKRQRARSTQADDKAEAYRNLFPRPADLPALPSATNPPATADKAARKAEQRALHTALSQLYLIDSLATPEQRHEALEQASQQSHLFSPAESKKLLGLIARHGLASTTARRTMEDELFFDFAPPSLLLPPLEVRTVRSSHVRAAEAAFQDALPALERLPPEIRSKNVRLYLNRMLYLGARIPSRDIFERVRTLFKRYNVEPDDYTVTARILLLDRTDQLGLLPGLWQNVCTQGKPSPLLFNAMLWAYSKRGQWDVAGQLYNRILANIPRDCPSLAFSDPPFFSSKALPIPAALTPGKDTYQCLVQALAYHGNLHSALHVLQDLTQDPAGLQPDVADLLALFHGFARFGEASPDYPLSQHEQAGLPRPESFPRIPLSGHGQPRRSASRLSEIWTQSLSQPDPADFDRWTLGTLDQVFESLLAMQPGDSVATSSRRAGQAIARAMSMRAPDTRGVFNILMAYSRCTSGNVARVQEVFGRLQAKYAPGNAEGWHGWRLDARLRRLVWTWQYAEGGDG